MIEMQERFSSYAMPEFRPKASRFRRADASSKNFEEDVKDFDLTEFKAFQDIPTHLYSLTRRTKRMTDKEIEDLQQDEPHVFTADLLKVIRSFDNSILRSIAVLTLTVSFHWSSLILEVSGVKRNGMFG